jgi:hypothetical protein
MKSHHCKLILHSYDLFENETKERIDKNDLFFDKSFIYELYAWDDKDVIFNINAVYINRTGEISITLSNNLLPKPSIFYFGDVIRTDKGLTIKCYRTKAEFEKWLFDVLEELKGVFE